MIHLRESLSCRSQNNSGLFVCLFDCKLVDCLLDIYRTRLTDFAAAKIVST